MNIFVLANTQNKCARYLCDKHVVKMILETAQMLCAVYHKQEVLPKDHIPYKATHINHPCTKWAAESKANYEWTCKLGLAISREYTFRYGKFHKSAEVIRWCIDNRSKLKFDHQHLTEFVQCMPDEFKCSNPIHAYRDYYQNKLDNSLDMRYTKREWPKWLVKDKNEKS